MQKIKFDKKKHVYTLGDKKLTSVTTWCKQFFEPFDAKAIAKQLASYYVNKQNKRGVRYWLKQWKDAAETGTKVHKDIETYIITGSSLCVVYPQARAAIDWLAEQNFIPDLDPEKVVFDDELGLAGTIDLVVDNGSRGLILVDWKTNKKFTNDRPKSVVPLLDSGHISQYTLQLSMYAYILERQGYKIDKLILVHLPLGGEAQSINIPYDKSKVEECIQYAKTRLK